MAEAFERGPDRIKRIPASERFRNDIMRADQFDDRSHRTAGNDACSVDRRLEQHMFGAEETMNFMRNRPALERNVHKMLLGLLDRLGYSDWHFRGFSLADPHPAIAIANDDQSAEIEPLAALHHFSDAINEDDLVFQI